MGKGMLRRLTIQNFKGFRHYDVEFSRLNLLVGGNNSGKTTIFHALQLFFWALEQIADDRDANVVLGKTQTSEIPVIPYADVRDVFFNQRLRTERNPTHIRLAVQADDVPELAIDLYQAYGRNFMIAGNDVTLTTKQFADVRRLAPVFVPSTGGVTAREDYYRPVSIDTMIHQGRQNQVLRNLVYGVRQSGEWEEFSDIIEPLFHLTDIDVPFDGENDLWLKAVYKEADVALDFVSAGSGFLQVVNLLTFLFRNPSKVALLDEPDSHMHEDLLRLAFDILDRMSLRRGLQVLIATHSPILIDEAGLENILLIDRADAAPMKAQHIEELVPLLADRGLSLPPSKVMDTLRSRKVLFVEGEEEDYKEFILSFGQILDPHFKVATRGLIVFEIGEGHKDWPFDAIGAFQRLIGAELKYVYVSDRDLMMPQEVASREARALREGQLIKHLSRRNRECYLIEPDVLSRLLQKKWMEKHGGRDFPPIISANGISAWFLDYAASQEDLTRTVLNVANEPNLRGDAAHRTAMTQEMNCYFREQYTEVIARRGIPWRLLDGKQALKAFRRYIAENLGLNFRDVEAAATFLPDEVAPDLRAIVLQLRSLFPAMEATRHKESTRGESRMRNEDDDRPLFRGVST